MKLEPRIPRTVPKGRRQRDPRRAAKHLAFIRTLPCITCGIQGSTEAAHVRVGTDGGGGFKPSDRYSLPLCAACHARQHSQGELTFWSDIGIDPLDAASALWTKSGDPEAGDRIIFRARQAIALRKP
jgi:hypothetical protein